MSTQSRRRAFDRAQRAEVARRLPLHNQADRTMQMKQLLRPCVMLSLAGTLTAATAQGVLPPCNSLPPGERESAQVIGACREGAPIVDVVPKGARGTSAVVVPVPRVVGLSFDDARSRLGNFTVRRSYVASAEPGGTVLEQQPAPSVRLGAGGVVRVVVSDGSLRPAPQVPATEVDGVPKPVVSPPLPPVSIPGTTRARSDGVDARRAPAPNSPPSRSNDGSERPAPASKSASTSRSSVARSDTRTVRTNATQIPPRSAAAQSPAPVMETLELPNVVGRTSTAATASLAEFKVDRIEVVANAAPSGQVLAQDPAPGTQVPAGTSIGLQVSDGSLASVSVNASPVAPAAEPSPAATVAPSPAPTAAPLPAPTAAPLPARAPMTFPSTAVLLLIAGVVLGLGLGALLMRRWLARPHAADTEVVAPTVLPSPVEPRKHERVAKTFEPVALSLPAMTAAPLTFAARLEEGKTTIEFAAPSDADEMTLEYSRDFHE